MKHRGIWVVNSAKVRPPASLIYKSRQKESEPLDPQTHGKTKVLNPQYIGEITPKNEETLGSHGFQLLATFFRNTFSPGLAKIAGGKDVYHLWNARLF